AAANRLPRRKVIMLNWADVINFAIKGNPKPSHKIQKSEQEWQELLDEEVFRVTRQHGTERQFSSAMCARFEPGCYTCACCNSLLHNTEHKVASHSSWP